MNGKGVEVLATKLVESGEKKKNFGALKVSFCAKRSVGVGAPDLHARKSAIKLCGKGA